MNQFVNAFTPEKLEEAWRVFQTEFPLESKLGFFLLIEVVSVEVYRYCRVVCRVIALLVDAVDDSGKLVFS